MKINDLYEQKSLIGINLKNCIRDKGYTKISFATKFEMDKKELEDLLAGLIIDRELFEGLLIRILDFLNMSVEDLLTYCPKSEKRQTYGRYNEMSDIAKKQYDLLMNVVDLCSIYYEPNYS